MKIVIDLPETTKAAVLNYITLENGHGEVFVKVINADDLEAGYIDYRKSEMKNDENA